MDLIENGIRNPIKHWYYQHKYWFISQSKLWDTEGDKLLLDVGAGSALFSKELLRTGKVKSAIAVDVGYKENIEILEDGVLLKQSTGYAGHSHFLLTDVLEHIENDQQFLSEIVKQADKESAFIITVPALMCLWSGHDLYLKHFRRYTKKNLTNLISNAGLKIVSIRYTYSTVFLLAYFQRKYLVKGSSESQMKDVNPVLRWILTLLLIPDRHITFLPFGVSIFLEAVKSD